LCGGLNIKKQNNMLQYIPSQEITKVFFKNIYIGHYSKNIFINDGKSNLTQDFIFKTKATLINKLEKLVSKEPVFLHKEAGRYALVNIKIFTGASLKQSYNGEYTLNIFDIPNSIEKKGVLINPLGCAFGMREKSRKNRLNKVFTSHIDNVSTYNYCLIVEGYKVYISTHTNLEALK
jgi:hypothetical protein